MFYLVYLIDSQIYTVVPSWWMKDSELLWEKFINHGLNTTQTHLCYWSTESPAMIHGRPNIEFEPTFTENSAESFYAVKIVRFFSK